MPEALARSGSGSGLALEEVSGPREVWPRTSAETVGLMTRLLWIIGRRWMDGWTISVLVFSAAVNYCWSLMMKPQVLCFLFLVLQSLEALLLVQVELQDLLFTLE